MSLMNIRNKKGPGTDPWGTPAGIIFFEDFFSFNNYCLFAICRVILEPVQKISSYTYRLLVLVGLYAMHDQMP